MKILSKEALPDAVAESLNCTADAVTRQAQRNIKKRMIVRTPFTLKSMESGYSRRKGYKSLNSAGGHNIDRMFSRAGTVSKYLWMQEGYTAKGMNGDPVAIAALSARKSRSKNKAISRRFRLNKGQRLQPGNLEDGKQFIGNPVGSNRGKARRYGLYVRSKGKLKMLRNLESKQVKIKDTNFFDDALKKNGTHQYIKAQFYKSAKKQIKRRFQ